VTALMHPMMQFTWVQLLHELLISPLLLLLLLLCAERSELKLERRRGWRGNKMAVRLDGD
jgi:hypothetical protein